MTNRRIALAIATGSAATAFGVLAWAFATNDYTLSYVADHGRRAASPAYRVVGTWAGMGGSLALWSTLIGAVGLVAVRRHPELTRVIAGTMATFLAVMLVAADPFARLGLPPLDGLGMNPILEHPAMLYHPPLLYLGLVSALPVFAFAVTARPGWRVAAHRAALVQLVLLTAGLLAGAHWAYVELDWGGYWAWDPVENSGLLPWLAAVLFVHVGRYVNERLARALATLPWILVVFGALLGRSGLSQSVHAFAEDRLVGWLLFVVAGATVVVALRTTSRRDAATTASTTPTGLPRVLWVPAALAAFATFVVGIGTFGPILSNDRRAIQGWFFARPLAVAAFVAIVAMTAAGTRPRRSGVVSHIGFAVLCIGFGFSTATTHMVAPLAPGATVEVAGVELENRGVDVADSTITATLDGGSHVYRPQLVGYAEQGLIIAETSLHRGLSRDVLVALRNAGDDGSVVVEVWVRPFMSLVWAGSLLLLAGFASARAANRVTQECDLDPSRSAAQEAVGEQAVVSVVPSSSDADAPASEADGSLPTRDPSPA
jgi:cytochrome c-type biogenesis protein CcmF